ncbi:MAG: 50S ribosomal protein L25 [Parcubacteria group bacterium]|nr:50S ribosomal protein L25 [Parcubacteria group bacterium]
MTTLEIKSKKREIFGKKLNTLRNQGLIPAVVYGGAEGSIPLVLELKEFKRVFKYAGETTLLRLFIDKENFKNVLIHDSSRDPITDEINHVDFYEVKMDEKITTKVPLVFTGNAPAILGLGGVLVKAMQELEIKALPADLPHEVEVDISSLKTFDDNILIKDVKLPKNIEVLDSISASIASVVPPRSESELEELSGEVKEKVEEVVVETEEKIAERLKQASEL